MSEHVNGTHRDQTILFPDTLDKYVDEGNPVRFIDAFIDSLNLEKLGFKHSNPFEDAVDDLFSIGVFGKWDDMREEFGRMSKERSDELKSALKNELNGIDRKIDQALTDGNFQNQLFISKIFSSHIAELKQHLCGNDFLFLQNTYSKIKALRSPSNLASVNKRRYEEVKDIAKTLQLLDKKDLWDDISADTSI